MKKTLLSLLALSAAVTSGCGNSDPDFTTSPIVGTAPIQARSNIPVAGGEVAIPAGTGFSGSLIFDPGATAGTELVLQASTEQPAGANLPLQGLRSPHATTEHFLFLTFNVSKPTPIRLLEGVKLRGAIPTGHEQYHADLYRIGGKVNAQTTESSFLQEFPGEHTGDEVVFDELLDGAVLEPGTTYAMGFKSTDQQLLELVVENNTGLSPCYIFLRGNNPNLQANDPRTYRVNAAGELVPMDLDDLVDGFADYSIELPEDGKIKLPLMASGRLYVSYGEKLKTQLDGPVLPTDPPCRWVAPDGWSDSAKPNYNTLWDWIEFDYKISPDSNLPGMGINTTQVQMMGIPMQLKLEGPSEAEPLTSGAQGDGTRTAIFNALAADPVFQSLIVEGAATGVAVSPIRAISADNGIRNVQTGRPAVPTFDVDYYDDYIDQVWEKYKTVDLPLVTSAFGTFLGRVNGQDQMIFTQNGERTIVVPKPTGADVIIGDGRLLADIPNCRDQRDRNIVGEMASCMSACFNRSTLLLDGAKLLRNPVPGTFDPTTFYQHPITNLYSKLQHAFSKPTKQATAGGAYGFGFDDNLDQSSFIADNKGPTKLTITIPKF